MTTKTQTVTRALKIAAIAYLENVGSDPEDAAERALRREGYIVVAVERPLLAMCAVKIGSKRYDLCDEHALIHARLQDAREDGDIEMAAWAQVDLEEVRSGLNKPQRWHEQHVAA